MMPLKHSAAAKAFITTRLTQQMKYFWRGFSQSLYCGLIWFASLAFAWRNWWKPKNFSKHSWSQGWCLKLGVFMIWQ